LVYKVEIPAWLWRCASQPVDPTPYKNDADMERIRGGDVSTPFCDPRPPVPSSQTRLAEVEQVLADFARSEGRAPSGSVRQQVEELIDRLHEYEKTAP
jgi:hypothetical protein